MRYKVLLLVLAASFVLLLSFYFYFYSLPTCQSQSGSPSKCWEMAVSPSSRLTVFPPARRPRVSSFLPFVPLLCFMRRLRRRGCAARVGIKRSYGRAPRPGMVPFAFPHRLGLLKHLRSSPDETTAGWGWGWSSRSRVYTYDGPDARRTSSLCLHSNSPRPSTPTARSAIVEPLFPIAKSGQASNPM